MDGVIKRSPGIKTWNTFFTGVVDKDGNSEYGMPPCEVGYNSHQIRLKLPLIGHCLILLISVHN